MKRLSRLHYIKIFLLASSLSAVLAACSSQSVRDDDPEAMYKDASDHAEGGRYELALEQLRIVKNKFPYSKYSSMAQLKIADVYFMQESFPEAAAAYDLFRDLHPNHPQVSYASFRIGESHYKDIPSPIARDLAPADRALESFTQFLKRFPNSKESPEARKRIKEVRSILAEKEKYVGDFYKRRGRYRSSLGRYEKISENYSDTDSHKNVEKDLPEVRQKAKAEAVEAAKKAQEEE